MKRRTFLKTASAGAVAAAVPGIISAALAPLSKDQIEDRVKELLGKMTLDEKIAQMSGEVLANAAHFAVGYGKYYTVNTPTNRRLNIPGLRFIDGPRGINLKGSTCFPVAMARGATWDVALHERVGAAMGYEARAQNANYWGGLCINALRHPSWGRSQETFGEDPYHLGRLAVGMLTGVQQHVMACAKHFAANSLEKSRHFVDVRMEERTLREIYLPHFKMCVDAGVASVMSAYNDLNGFLCGHNKHLLRDILKNDWGFPGFVLSDFGAGVKDTVAAANAGLDIEMPMTEFYGKKLKAAVQTGAVPLANIDEAVTRILREKMRFLHLEDNSGYDRKKIAGPEHTALAREVEEKAIVLLKNEAGALPLQRGEIKTIAVLGELADTPNTGDKGSSTVRPPYVITPLQGLQEKAGSGVRVIYHSAADDVSVERAAKSADAVIVVVGCNFLDEGESFDRLRLTLSDRHEQLIKTAAAANRRCIVVVEAGGAVIMENWKDRVPAILMAWYPGMEGGNAIANVIFGDANPSGKLPIVFPKTPDQLPPFDNTARQVEYGYYHGYRLFDKKALEPAFPFGFGRSYTKYRYGNLRLSEKQIGKSGKLEVKVDVSNIGPRAGEEIVQLYVGYQDSQVDRPVKDLKGFGKLSLAPGETKTLALELAAADLAYYNAANHSWELEEISYLAQVGPSSRSADLLTDTFRIAGT